MARTIAERISQAAERSFVGRRVEFEALRDAILSEDLPFVVAYIHGPGGIGKSRLVQATLGAVSPPARALLLDCGQIEPTPRGFLRAVSAALDGDDRDPDLDGVARMLGDCAPRTVLALDTYETFGLMDALFQPEVADLALADADPLTRAWLDHLRRDPVAEGERVLFLRSAGDHRRDGRGAGRGQTARRRPDGGVHVRAAGDRVRGQGQRRRGRDRLRAPPGPSRR